MSSILQPIYFLVYLDCLHIPSVMQGEKKKRRSVVIHSELHKGRKDFSHLWAQVGFEVTRDRVYELGCIVLGPK